MRELALNVMDVAQNSISAGASLITLTVAEDSAAEELSEPPEEAVLPLSQAVRLTAAIIPIKIAIPFFILHTPFLFISQALSRAGCTGPNCTVI